MDALVVMCRIAALVGARLRRGDAGATAAEYALLAALVAAVIVISVSAVGGHVLALFDSAEAGLP